ncbi:MAG: hypothetical protein WBG57_05485, partial [Ornithinimicrobium sp.]
MKATELAGASGSARASGIDHISATQKRPSADSWHRWEWLISAIWLVFLIFPLFAAVTAPVDLVWRALTVVALLMFGAVYAWSFVQIGRCQGTKDRLGIAFFVPLVLITLLVIPVINWNALGLVPFLVAFSSFFFSRFIGVSVIISGLAICAVGIVVYSPAIWVFPGIILMVGISTQLISVLDEKQSE